MHVIGKQILGRKNAFDFAEHFEGVLNDAGYSSRRGPSSFAARTYTRLLNVAGTPVTINYNTSGDGWATISIKRGGRGDNLVSFALSEASRKYPVANQMLLRKHIRTLG